MPRQSSAYLSEDVRPLLRLRTIYPLPLTVRGPDGRPIEGATITVKGSGYVFRERTTDADGRATFGGFVAPRDLTLCVRHADYATQFHGPYIIGPETAAAELVMEPARTLSGWVVDRAGQPVSGARVRAVVDEPTASVLSSGRSLPLSVQEELGGPSTTADSLGAFELRGIGSGEVRVQALRGGVLLAETAARGGESGLVLREDDGDKPLRFVGTIADSVTGEAVRGALVWFERSRGIPEERVDGRGRRLQGPTFEMTAGTPGDWTLLVQADGYAPYRTDPRRCDPGEHRFDVVLIPARDLWVQIQDLDGPLPGTLILPLRDSAPERKPDENPTVIDGTPVPRRDYTGLVRVADADGRVHLRNVPSSGFQLALHVRNFIRPFLFDVPPGEFDAERPFVAKVEASCSGPRRTQPWELFDGATGEQFFRGPPGEFDLQIYDADGALVQIMHLANRPPQVSRAIRPRLRVPRERAGSIVIEETALPNPWWWLGPGPHFYNGAERMLPDLHLPPGRLRCVVTATGYETTESWIDVAPTGAPSDPLRFELSRPARAR